MATIATTHAILTAVTPCGIVSFADVGDKRVATVTEEQAQYLASIPGYVLEEAAAEIATEEAQAEADTRRVRRGK